MSALQDRLADLEAREAGATARWQEARNAAARVSPCGRTDVLQPLARYVHDVWHGTNGQSRRPPSNHEPHGGLDPAVVRRLMDDLFQRIDEEGLLLLPANPRPLRTSDGLLVDGLLIHDHRPAAELESATVARDAARRDLGAFKRDSEAIQRERDRAEMDRLRDALAGDDPAAVGEAIRA